jgi:hypothetical protein
MGQTGGEEIRKREKRNARYERRVLAGQLLIIVGMCFGTWIASQAYNAFSDYTQNNTEMGRILSGRYTPVVRPPVGLVITPVLPVAAGSDTPGPALVDTLDDVPTHVVDLIPRMRSVQAASTVEPGKGKGLYDPGMQFVHPTWTVGP